MQVDVVCLRHNGDKLPPDVIAATTPVRGDLTMENHRRHIDRVEGRNFIIATIGAPAGALPVNQLLYAVVTKMTGDSFLIAGLEVHTANPQPGASFQCDQTWWCRLVRAH